MEIKISVRSGGEFKGSKNVQTPCVIGRSKEVGLTISHPSVSRRHCEIYEEAGWLYLRDNSSLNGTMLRGEFVEDPVRVQLGDEFVIGELQLRLEPLTSTDAETDGPTPFTHESEPEMVTVMQPISAGSDDGELRLAPE